jgi:predicted choloylglycine hydrolase
MSSERFSEMTAAEIERLIERSLQQLVFSRDRAALPVLLRLARSVGTAIGSAGTYVGWTDRQLLRQAAQDAIEDSAVRHSPGTTVSVADVLPAESNGLTFYGIRESLPGPRWQALFEAMWPAYRSWYLSEGNAVRPSLAVAGRQLVRHMPELVPTWERLVELTDGDETAARMLTLYDPPRFLPGCSQAVLGGAAPMLVRNYDYDPDLCERVVYSSAFTGRRVIGMGDCLWGLLDGMNDRGLAVSLAFGGRGDRGMGFGIPLVVRYLLEVAETVGEATAVLARTPVNMSYNLTLLDRNAEVATAFVAPGISPEVSRLRAATNHRGTVPDCPEHASRFRSVQRQETLLDLLATNPDPSSLVAAFQRPPLYTTEHASGFGTVYTAAYRPDLGIVDYLWPGSTWRRGFDSPDGTHTIAVGDGGE